MPTRRTLLFGMTALLAVGCGGGAVTQAKFERLKIGMTSQEVQAILGKDGKELGPGEVEGLMREALTPKAGPDGKAPAKVQLPDLTGARGVRWGDDKKSITVIYSGDRVSRLFKKGF